MFNTLNLSEKIQQLSPTFFWISITILAILVIGYFKKAITHLRKIYLFSSISQYKIASAKEGVLKLSGTIKPLQNEITAPLSQKKCVWYHYKVQSKKVDYDSQRNRRVSWVTEKEGSSSDWFILSDESGECIIAPSGAEVICSDHEQWRSDAIPDELSSNPFIKDTLAFILNSDYRLIEDRLHTNDPLIALGNFKQFPLSSETLSQEQLEISNYNKLSQKLSNFKSNYLENFHFSGSQSQTNSRSIKTVFDLRSFNQQWSLLKQKLTSGPNPPNSINLVTGITSLNHPYILSSLPIQKLLWRIRFLAFGTTLGFVICLALLVAGLIIRF